MVCTSWLALKVYPCLEGMWWVISRHARKTIAVDPLVHMILDTEHSCSWLIFWFWCSTSTLVQRRPVGDAFQNGKAKEMQNQAAPRTMDALFAQMKAQRMRTVPQQQANPAPGHQFNPQRRVQQQQQQRRGRGYGGRNVGNQWIGWASSAVPKQGFHWFLGRKDEPPWKSNLVAFVSHILVIGSIWTEIKWSLYALF